MFIRFLAIIAPHGSTFVGSVRTARTISVHLSALVVLRIEVKIHERSLLMDFVEGKVHCVPCNIAGMTRVAIPWLSAPAKSGILMS